MCKIVCSGPSRQVGNPSAGEVSREQQFWDAAVHFSHEPTGFCPEGQEALSHRVGPVGAAGNDACR